MHAIPSETMLYEAQNEPVEVIEEIIEETPVAELESLIRAKFPEDQETAVAIAKCESGLNPDAYNDRNYDGSVDRGLMQLNSVHDPALAKHGLDPWNPDDNLEFARMLYDQGGWSPWVCYTHKLI